MIESLAVGLRPASGSKALTRGVKRGRGRGCLSDVAASTGAGNEGTRVDEIVSGFRRVGKLRDLTSSPAEAGACLRFDPFFRRATMRCAERQRRSLPGWRGWTGVHRSKASGCWRLRDRFRQTDRYSPERCVRSRMRSFEGHDWREDRTRDDSPRTRILRTVRVRPALLKTTTALEKRGGRTGYFRDQNFLEIDWRP